MAKHAVFPCSRKRKMSAPTDLIRIDWPNVMKIEVPLCDSYDSAFLADRGCFTPMYSRRMPGNVRLDQRRLA
jgi:hypothetical protein